MPSKKTIDLLLQRFGGATPEMLDRVLTPYRLRLVEITTEPVGTRKTRTVFKAEVPKELWTTFEEGTTGKVVPQDFVEGDAPWKEVIKGRILSSLPDHVEGELYFDSARLKNVLTEVKCGDYLEIDPFGVTSKIESALCEAALFLQAQEHGFKVTRMPENVAKHVGTQNYFDFRLEKGKSFYRVELKSLWGTDTTKARLIHTVSRDGAVRTAREKIVRYGQQALAVSKIRIFLRWRCGYAPGASRILHSPFRFRKMKVKNGGCPMCLIIRLM